MGVPPLIFGPTEWQALHIESYAYPDQPTDEQKEAALQRILCLRYLLPCPYCKVHWTKYCNGTT